jgi:hypothetical protein
VIINSYTLAPSHSSIESYVSARPLQPPEELLSSIELLEQCSLLHYLIILFFGRSGRIFQAFFASTDLRADLLAVCRWTNVEEFVKACTQLKKEPGEIGNCSTISLSLDGWKSQNVHKIFAIIVIRQVSGQVEAEWDICVEGRARGLRLEKWEDKETSLENVSNNDIVLRVITYTHILSGSLA